ncbi:LytR C-terminal domain-containing protein [Actinacidiphila yeochonensis]|uniref:LytR C-terminal domain-containing protein n=1 Tax=Actinacidiphila yeochonensis TaxID=89050 RepID=UPI00069254C4|nr:LytR C-terminal domain-containing protein [Actinacidiphila yeochonensis]
MSMLTPSGMGGKYRITGTAYPRMRPPRRRGRVVAVLCAAVVALGLLGWGGLQLYSVFTGRGGDKKASAAPQDRPSCAPTTPPAASGKPLVLPQPEKVVMNVYNATEHGGLAKATADELASRGFKVAKFGNAPVAYITKIPQSALVLAGPAGEAAAREAGTQVAGSLVKIDPNRKGDTVDLMIGNTFGKLATPAQAAAARVTAANPPAPKPSCAPTTGSGKSSASGKNDTARTTKH